MFYPAKLLNHIGITFMKLDEIMETDQCTTIHNTLNFEVTITKIAPIENGCDCPKCHNDTRSDIAHHSQSST
jgi:hypothetical protein